MTSGNGPRTEAGDTWPPTIEHSAGLMPTITADAKRRERGRGRFALLSALTGLGIITTGIALAAHRMGESNKCYLLWLRSIPSG